MTALRLLPLLLLLALPAAHAGPLRDLFAGRAASGLDDGSEGGGRIELPAGTRAFPDQAYGGDPAQRVDVYVPPGAKAAPVLVMVHGGGWRHGDKASPGVVQEKAARWLPRGFVLVSVNYRLLPQAGVAAQADDVAAALAFVQAHAGDWGGDGRRVVLMGHSAGAHLAALLAADPARVQHAGGRGWLGTVSLDSAALDVEAVMQRRHLPLYDAAFGDDAATWRALSPLRQLTPQATPLLLVCSSTRRDHPCDQAQAMATALARQGSRAQVQPEAMSHREINVDLGKAGDYTDAVERFLASLDPELARRLAPPVQR